MNVDKLHMRRCMNNCRRNVQDKFMKRIETIFCQRGKKEWFKRFKNYERKVTILTIRWRLCMQQELVINNFLLIT